MSKTKNSSLNTIIQHPDKEEIINKLILGFTPDEIHSWLKNKYSSLNDHKFVLSNRLIKNFNDNNLETYKIIQEDILKTKAHLNSNSENDLQLALENVPGYKKVILQAANEELDIRKIVKRLCVMIEQRLSQVFDEIQEDPRNINTRIDRLLIEYTEVLGNILEKYYKFTEAPENISITNNITVQAIDQHISVFQDVVKELLQDMDFDASLKFMELYTNKIAQINAPNTEANVLKPSEKLAEVKLLNEAIDNKLNS